MGTRKIAPNGGRLRPEGGWKAYADAVDAAQAKRPKIRKPGLPANMRPGRIHLVDKAPRCVCIARRTGQTCRVPAVKGSTRCKAHGGLLDVPDHPAAARVGAIARERAEAGVAQGAFLAFDTETKTRVRQAYEQATQRRRRGRWHSLLQGAQAISTDDNGKAFRRWLASLKDE